MICPELLPNTAPNYQTVVKVGLEIEAYIRTCELMTASWRSGNPSSADFKRTLMMTLEKKSSRKGLTFSTLSSYNCDTEAVGAVNLCTIAQLIQ
ncbi:hypothetical protein BaRGS_00009026 [Batillaria attramentaria]|uniref:Uncharacterized protein n=1 Tax=Batillaria attramentaria TaxID=370345 RepID=A0ABD0LJJ8_9CAEN